MSIRPRQLTDVVEIIWRRKRILFLMSLAMLIATYLVIKRIPAIYESKAMVVVNTDFQAEGLTLPESVSFGSVMQNLTSRGTLVTLIRRHSLYPSVKDIDDAASKLLKNIKIEVKNKGFEPDGPESITLTFRHNDAAAAQRVLSDLVSNFEQTNKVIRSRAGEEARVMGGMIEEVEEQLKKIGPARDLEFIRSQAATRSATEGAALTSRRFTLESSAESLSDREFALQNQVNDIRQQIADQEKLMSSASTRSPAVGNPAYGALLVRRADLEAQLKIFLSQYTEKNPKVIAAREQLNEVERQMKRLESAPGAAEADPAQAAMATELRRLKQQQNQLQSDLDLTRRALNRTKENLTSIGAGSGSGVSDPSMLGGPLIGAGRMDYDRLLARYNFMLGKQDMLNRLAGIAGSATPMFQIVDHPNLPGLPVAPNKLFLMAIGLGLAAAFGLLIAFAFEIPKLFLLNDERDIEYYLGAPVLALIPETMTPVERVRDRRLRWTRGLIILLLSLALIPALYFSLNIVQVFQLLGSK